MSVWTTTARIYYEDTDFSGVVYHANYLKYFERGRTEALRDIGMNHSDLFDAEDPMAFTARSVNLEFIKPARIDDLLTIETRVEDLRGARMTFDQRALRGEDLLATAKVLVACMDLNGRPRRLPKAMVEKLTNGDA